MTVHVSVDPELCIGSGDCARLAPEAFVIDETRGISVPLEAAVAADAALLAQAAYVCPTQAIRIVDDDGKTLYGQ